MTKQIHGNLKWVIVIGCFIVSLYVGASEVPNSGLSMLFLLPLSFSFSVVLFWKEYEYCRNSFGLAILYAESFVRYIITPVLIVMSKTVVRTIHAGDADYFYAVIVEVFELFMVMISIYFIWPKHLIKRQRVLTQQEYDFDNVTFRLTWTGLIFVVLMIGLVLARGHLNNILTHLSTWFYRINNKEDLYNYDLMAFNVVKTVIILIFISIAKKLYNQSGFKAIALLIAIAAGLLNTMFYVYNERTDLAVLVIAAFFVLKYAFPKDKKFLSIIFGVGGVLLVALVFMEGSLQYQVGSSISSVNLEDISKSAELYTTGPSVIANAHMNYDIMRSQVNLMTYAKDLVKSCDLFSTLPFLRFIGNAVSSGRSSVEIYVASVGGLTYILPNHSLAALYVGDVFCWLLEPIFIILNIKLLGWFERTMFKVHDLAQIYAILSIVTMVPTGIFGNNFILMLHSFSSLPLWLLIFSYVNNLGNRMKLKV